MHFFPLILALPSFLKKQNHLPPTCSSPQPFDSSLSVTPPYNPLMPPLQALIGTRAVTLLVVVFCSQSPHPLQSILCRAVRLNF